MINIVSVKLFRQIIRTREPTPIYQLFQPGQINTHCVSKYYTKIKPKLADTRGFFVHKVTEIWNNLPPEFHNLGDVLFNKRIKIYAIKDYASDKLHRDGGYVTI